MTPRIVPARLADGIEAYVHKELSDAERYENSEPLDEDGVYGIYTLVAEAYAAGYEDGMVSEARRQSARRQRDRERALNLHVGVSGEPE